MLDPHAIAARHADPVTRALTAFVITVAERPWAITSTDRDALRSAGLDDAAILHALLQAALFGHLNRVADAVGVAADYPDRFGAPRPEPATPAYLAAPSFVQGESGPVTLALREGIAERLAGWTSYVMERDHRRRRLVIRSAVATLLGDATAPLAAPVDELDHALASLARVVTLAPWQLGATAYDRLRTHGLEDAAIFDAVAVASTAGAASRIAVVLAGFGR